MKDYYTLNELLDLGKNEIREIIKENYRRLNNQTRTFGPSYRPGSQKAREWEYNRNIETAILAIRILDTPHEKLYQNKAEASIILTSIVEINDQIKEYLARNPEKLYNLTPRKFEELIASILKDSGFDVNLTKATKDGGIDIYARLNNKITSFLMFVECKKWAGNKLVGLDVVQRVYGIQKSHKANKSMIVTTSFFTKPAIEENKIYENDMDLKDFNSLKEWLKKYLK